MSGHIAVPVNAKCWNTQDSYGLICVHCGCCSTNKQKRYEARLKHLNRWLNEMENFTGWAYKYPDQMEIQKLNIASNIAYYKRRIRYYEKKLKELTE